MHRAAEWIAGLLTGTGSGEVESVERDIVGGPADIDKLDYLLRDSHYCGVEYGRYDLDKVIESARVARHHFGVHTALAFDEEVLPDTPTFEAHALPGDPNLVQVPATALISGDHGTQVAVLGDGDKVVMKPIQIGRDFGDSVEVTAGLADEARSATGCPVSLICRCTQRAGS